MHRNFIALILATAITVTGLSAVPARADEDVAKILAGLAAIALIGAAIRKNNREEHQTVTQYQTGPAPRIKPRPLPPRFGRYDLPSKCLRPFSVNGRNRNLFGAHCLKKRYGFNGQLPRECRLGYWDGKSSRMGYDPKCLRTHGYRLSRR